LPRGGLFGRRRSRVEFEITPATFGTLGLAAIAGLRSMAAPALLARAVRRGDLDAPNLPSLAKKEVSGLLSILAAGEMAARPHACYWPDDVRGVVFDWEPTLVSGPGVLATVRGNDPRLEDTGRPTREERRERYELRRQAKRDARGELAEERLAGVWTDPDDDSQTRPADGDGEEAPR